jgi:two-component system chemotaxis sensor kinase CheA
MAADSIPDQILELTRKLAQELRYAEAGKDNGLLPVNSFVGDMEELLGRSEAPNGVVSAIGLAREWIDQIFDTTAIFDEESLKKLGEWSRWMLEAIPEWSAGRALPPQPEAFSEDSPAASSEASQQIRSQVEKLSLELAFAEEGKDTGLLPINSFIFAIEESLPSSGLPPEILGAVAQARSWMDQIFDTTAVFDARALRRLESWSSWMDAALERAQTGTAIPPTPLEWSQEERVPEARAGVQPPNVVPSPQSVAVPRERLGGSSVKVPPVAAASQGTPMAAVHSGEEPPLALNLEGDDRDLIVGFISESYEHLQNIEQGVLVLEENPSDAPTLNSIFRAFHTFKGGAGCVNLTQIKDLAHELESLLDAARQHKLEISTDIINVILEGGDTLAQFVKQISERLNGRDLEVPIRIPTLQLIARTRHLLEGGHGLPPGSALAVVASGAGGGGALVSETSVKAVEQASPKVDEAAGLTAVGGKPAAAPAVPAKGSAHGSGGAVSAAGFVKVDTMKLDSLIDLVGELVISESMVAQDPELRNLPSRNLARNLGQLRRITSELQRTAMSLRMVPIRATFQKMLRLVRDLGAKQQKQVQLLLSGEDTELDRNIVEEISDPLVHMIRNAADHGVEKPEDRLAKGKPAMGTIHLRAFHKGGNIVIQIEDDGNGLNKERILAKAREKGILKPNETLPEKEVYDLIFAPGFSTAEVVSDISGRGVGMDVVRQNIEKLRGKVEIDTVPGQGTTFTIYLPLTLAIIDGMIVSIGGQRYIIPTLSVRESFRPKPEMISSIHERGEMVNVRGRLSPLLRLYQYLEQEPKVTDPAEAIIVVVESGQQTRCLMVDELIGKQEVVIKSLGGALKRNHALAGGAVLGDGRVGLILNVDALVRLSGSGSQGASGL